jgi:SAM-dependent methyltransferase
LQQLWVDGAEFDWAAFDADHARQRVDLPTMPWQRRRHWFDLPDDAHEKVAGPMHAWRSLASALDRASGQGPIGVDLSGYDARWASLERLTVAAASATLRDAGCFMQAGERATVDEVRRRLGASETYRHLLQRWLERLAQRWLLVRDGEHFVAAQPLPDPGLASVLQEAAQQLAGNAPLLDYLRHCCGLLGAVIGGRESALETLFPGGSFDLAEGLYERSATGQYLNGLAATALQAMVAARPGHAWRVLEAGAGTGGSSAALLPLLPAGSSYVFTDITEFFLERAGLKFAAYPALRLATFDLEAEPAAQGLAEGSFDLVLAANAVHAVRDLRAVLARLRRLLAPGGMLMLMEATEHLAWFDISTGLIEGWQVFADDLRTDQPLLTPTQWVGALRDAGFEQAQAWPPAGSSASALAAHVVIARVPGPQDGIRSVVDGTFDARAGAPGPGQTALANPPQHAAAAWRQRLLDALPAERVEAMRELVRQRVMAILRLDADQAPGPNDRLLDLGFDSLMAVQLRGQLGEALGLAKGLPATLLFDHPTIAEMAACLLDRMTPAASGTAPAMTTGAAQSDERDSALATNTPAANGKRRAEVAAMSDDEVEAMLMERLGRP